MTLFPGDHGGWATWVTRCKCRDAQIQQNQGGVSRIEVPVGPIQIEPPTQYDVNMDNYVDPISQMKPTFTDGDFKKFVKGCK